MMRFAVCLSLLMCAAATASAGGDASATKVTPMEKVISLIKDLKKKVEAEGVKEASSYATFAKFCKDKTKRESKDIKKGSDTIEKTSADLQKQVARRDQSEADTADRRQKVENLEKTLADDTAACAADKAKYEANAADTSKAISSLKSAIKSMSGSKPSLIQLRAALMVSSVRDAVQEKTGVDPADADFKFHSNDIIELCQSMLKDFTTKKAGLDKEWTERKAACAGLKKSSRDSIDKQNHKIGKNLKYEQARNKDAAADRKTLIKAKAELSDDELYLKDITMSCEARANDWDQRTQQRKGELDALNSALSALTGTAAGAAKKVNARAALVQVRPVEKHAVAPQAPSLIQLSSGLRGSLSPEKKVQRVLSALQSDARSIGSLTLSALSVRAQGSPFEKVRKLMQGLIEGLLEQQGAESTKKGYCDTQLATNEATINDQYEEVKDLSTQIASGEAKMDNFKVSIKELTAGLKANAEAQAEATSQRKQDKDDNLETLKTAQEGLGATSDALDTLKSFYKDAAKASAFVQLPVTEVSDAEDKLGFGGSYQGAQASTGAIFGLLETIQSDFDRTIRTTKAMEDEQASDFQELMQGSLADSAGKQTAKELDEQDLKSTTAKVGQLYETLDGNMNMLDEALKEREELKPTCIDTGMSYKERVAKREAEIKALKNALNQLKK